MAYGKVHPSGPLWEGVYIDDHCVVLKLPRDRLRCQPGHACAKCEVDGGRLADLDRIEASRQKYAEVGLPVASGKSFDQEQDFEVWGTRVSGHSGRVGVDQDKLRQVFRLLVSGLGLPTTQGTVQSMLGAPLHAQQAVYVRFRRRFQLVRRARTTSSLPASSYRGG